MSLSAADQTDYPKIFKGLYWDISRKLPDDIITNRNKFVKDFNIKAQSSAILGSVPSGCSTSVFDHIEIYLTNSGGYVIVTSPYEAPYRDDLASSLGFIKYDPMYGKRAVTLVQEFYSRAEWDEFKRLLKELRKQ